MSYVSRDTYNILRIHLGTAYLAETKDSSIKRSTVASSDDSIIGEEIGVGCFQGIQWCSQIFADFPLPICQQEPQAMT